MRKLRSWKLSPIYHQKLVFRRMVKKLEKTKFGKDHSIHKNMTIAEFQSKVPLYEYEDYSKYIELLKTDAKDVLWKGKMDYFGISSGTTSGEKLIPLYATAINSIVVTSFNLGYAFMDFTKAYNIFKKKIFHLYGLGVVKKINNIKYGYIGHLANSKVPAFLVRSKYSTDAMKNAKSWKEKIEHIAGDIINQDLSVISGTPPWMNNVLEAFVQKHHKSFSSQFPNLQLYIHGGCSFNNYRSEFFRLLGDNHRIWTQEVYPATEGYIAFQDHWDLSNKTKPLDMLLNVGENIFFEFLLYENDTYDRNKRLTVAELEVDKVYILVLSTIGCFISYIIGDTIEVTSLRPLRIKFAGRIKQNVNLVNEHMDFRTISLIFEDIKKTLSFAINDFVLLPRVENGHAFYHWVLEVEQDFNLTVEVQKNTIEVINQASMNRNPFYKSWFTGGVLKKEQVLFVHKNALLDYLKSEHSVGQNKVPHVVLAPGIQKKILDFMEMKSYSIKV